MLLLRFCLLPLLLFSIAPLSHQHPKVILSLKQYQTEKIDPEDILLYSGNSGIPGEYQGSGGGGGYYDLNPLTPQMNATAGVDLGPPHRLNESPMPVGTTSTIGDPTSVQSVESGTGYYNNRPALTPGPAAPAHSKRTTSAGIVDPFATAKRKGPQPPSHSVGARFTPTPPHRHR